MYIKCWTFENISCFENVWCVFERMFVLKMSKQLRTFLPHKSICSLPPPLDVAILPLIGKKLYLWMQRDGHGSSYGHDSNVVRYISISLEGLRSFVRQHS